MRWPDQSSKLVRVTAPRRRYIHVAQQVLAAISRGEYVPGQRLPGDRDIAQETGVSRPTAREAVLALELIGAVEVRPGGGVFVAHPGARLGALAGSPLDAPPRELIESRCQIEPAVARLSAMRLDTRRLEEVRELVDRTAELVDVPERLPEFIALGLKFHSVLGPCCGNRLLAGIVGQLVDVEEHPLWTLVNQQAMRTREARAGQVAEHHTVLDAIAAGDPEGAAEAMTGHLDRLAEQIFGPIDMSATSRAG